jgi:hypothetical protein
MPSTYNFFGNVGAVQTGPNATANIQSLTAEGRAELISAIDSLQAALACSDLSNRDDLEEVAEDAKTGLASAHPNLTKINSYLMALSEAAQGIASARPAYDALKALLAPVGIFLP